MAQEITTKTVEALPEDSNLVRPYDKVDVYSTGKVESWPEGTHDSVHPLLAKKLIDAGKATKDKPKAKKEKEDK